MTYLQFHFVFIFPVIIILGVLFYVQQKKFAGTHALAFLVAIAAIALVYTTAWDNYLVFKGIWWYGEERVLGTIGYVPIEEYMFFLLQPFLTGFWFYFLLSKSNRIPEGVNQTQHRRIGGTVVLVSLIGGWLLMQMDAGLYMGLIIIWAGPVLGGQWWFAGSWMWAARTYWLLGIGVPTLYLWVADRIAIGLGIWTISDQYTLGIELFGLPIEEATFFLVTNVLVVQGLMLFLHVGDPQRGFEMRSEYAESGQGTT